MDVSCTIIDDDQEARERLSRLLSQTNHVDIIAQADNGAEGVRHALEKQPDVVFVDVEMPGMTGFDVVREVREQGGRHTFIFVTGYDQYAIRAIRHAAFDFLVKPVDIDDLKAALERFIEQKSRKENGRISDMFIRQHNLTGREVEILSLLAKNQNSKEIAEALFISKHTVDTYRRRLLEKTGYKSTNELVHALLKANG